MADKGRTVAVSAPGKVLLAGGYIVLDRKHTGLVFGLSARIHVVAQEIRTSEGVHLSEIVVSSPQFLNATWRYGYHLVENGGGIKVTQLQSGTPIDANPFVETTLNYVLTYIAQVDKRRSAHGFKPASLTVLADNDYYSRPKLPNERPSSSSSAGEHLPPPQSQPQSAPAAAAAAPTTSAASAAAAADDDDLPKPIPPSNGTTTTHQEKPPRPRFRHFSTTLRDAHKTGLGSSAAIVTALTAALLSHYLPPSLFDLNNPRGRRVLHNLAQVAHCSAQGKIGSGFDVASAVYGSCGYRRFSAGLLGGLGHGGVGFGERLRRLVDDDGEGGEGGDGEKEGEVQGGGDGDRGGKRVWDCEISKDSAGLPPGVAIRMCDVDCGTQTVSMVKKVHAWRDANPELAAGVYDDLQQAVDGLARALGGGSTKDTEGEGQEKEIGSALRRVRELMRALGERSGAPIEPESQTAMLNALERVEGVFGTVVPGAGGYDAAAVVMRDDKDTERRVKEFLREWSAKNEIRVRLMKVRGETEGVRMEDAGEFPLWIR